MSKGVEETNKLKKFVGVEGNLGQPPGQPLLDFAALHWSSVILNSLHVVWGLPSLTPVGGVGPGEGMRRFHTS